MSNQKQNNADELSLKEIILKLQDYIKHAFRYWWLIALFIIASVIYQIYQAISHDVRYHAPLTFMINEDESSSLGGLSSLLGSFGGLLGGGSEYNLDKILQISQSDRIAEGVLLKKIEVNNRVDYIANHLIESNDTIDQWIKIKWLDRLLLDDQKMDIKKQRLNYRFSADSINYNDRVQTYVLKKLFNVMFGNRDAGEKGIVATEYGDITGIMSITTSSYNQKLSISITDFLFEELKEFYIKKSIEKQQNTYDIMKMKHDSIQTVLLNNEYALANFEDTSRKLFMKREKLKQDQMRRNIAINTMALGKAKENLEITDFALRDKTPFVQIIDRPFSPLKNSSPNLIMSIILGILIGGFIGVAFVMIRKIYRDIMNS